MKLFHLADLHLGKRLGELSLISEQKYILQQIVQLVRMHNPQAVLIAGDIYDKATPSAEAVELFDSFLSELAALGTLIFVIAGNHDSGSRLSFGRDIFSKQGLYIAGHFTGKMQSAEAGGVCFWLLPYLRPGEVRRYLERDDIETHEQAVQAVLSHTEIDREKVNVILTHQFVTGQGPGPLSAAGGLENVCVEIYADFDYVACGHLHIPQKIGRDTARYCGSPLKYSFSEAHSSKSVTMVDIRAKDQIEITLLPLTPLRDMRVLTGLFKEILANAEFTEDYIKVVLTDRIAELPPDAIGTFRKVYPNLLKLCFQENEAEDEIWESPSPENRNPLELFAEFYQKQTGGSMTEAQEKLIREVLSHETP